MRTSATKFFFLLLILSQAPLALALRLAFPVDCQFLQNCYIQYYKDQDPGPAFSDYMNGNRSYDTHTGTDFAIATYKEMKQGVNVLAAASGVVRYVRDGERNRNRGEGKMITSKECGNGVVIEHANGYDTQYCHMYPASIKVKPGQSIRQGQILGKVGSSGKADFPHLHFMVRKDGQLLDPFAQQLWQNRIPYIKRGVIDMGLNNGPISAQTVLHNPNRPRQLSAHEPLVAWIRLYGSAKGRQKFEFIKPNGEIYQRALVSEVDKSYKEWFSMSGFKTPPTGFDSGSWQVHYYFQAENEAYELLKSLSFEVE